MVGTINSAVASALFGGSASTSEAGVGASLLAAWAAARAGVGVDTTEAGRDPDAPLAEVWRAGLTPSDEKLVDRARAGKAFFDLKAQLFTDLGATGDYRRLFALHTGLSTMNALAGKLQDAELGALQKSAIEAQFARGLSELKAFFASQQFENLRLAQGDRIDEAQTTLAIPSTAQDYITGLIHKGSLGETLAGLDKNARFDIVAVTPGGTERRAEIDLSEMGSIPRSLGNVISFVNAKLAAASIATRFVAENLTPKTQVQIIAGQLVDRPYVGQRQYALKVDIGGGETVSFEPVAPAPAFYLAGQVGSGGARLVKLSDVSGAAGQPVWLDRPDATDDPIGAHVATGYLGPGAPYVSAPANAYEKKTSALVSDGANSIEDRLREAGEAVLKLSFDDGRVLQVTTAWRADDLEAWRARAGESEDRAILDDLAERLSQLLHEQGVAAGVDVWEDGTDAGLTIFTGDHVKVSRLEISGGAVALSNGDDPAGGFVGGLRAGVFARRFEAAGVAGASELLVGEQKFVVTTAKGVETISISGGEAGLDAATIASTLNGELRTRAIAAAASFVDVGGVLTLRVETLHDAIGVSATINGDEFTGALQPAGAWVQGGLPLADAGEPYGDAVRRTNVTGAAPLSTYASDLAIDIIVATPTGNKTVSVAVSAAERAANPDSGGQWNAIFQERLQSALNAAGVYVGALSSDLTQWGAAEGAGHRIASITINGDALTLQGSAPAFGLGGAFGEERSFTSAQGASAVNADVADLIADPTASITFGTVWGVKTVSASLQVGDARTLESAALRLNEALAAAGYDLGVAAVDLAGGGSGLRIVSGDSHSVRQVDSIALGAGALAVTLDPIDSTSHDADPLGAARVAVRATRGASVLETVPAASTFSTPSVNTSGWFAGRAFDVAVGGGATVATARAVAAGPDGSVFVLADLAGDAGGVTIKGARDVALFKYDSAGKLLFSRVLGAAEEASGFALAVSADGKAAVAGSVTGALSNAGVAAGKADSFVTLFDASGAELWTQRRGAVANDQVNALAFAPDGSLIVAGKTESALGPALAAGGWDAYVRGYSAAGLELFTRQFGTSLDDGASALLVRDAGAGSVEIVTGGVENYRGVLRRFTYSSSAGLVAGSTRDIGFFYEGAINALAADGANLYVGGAVGADRLSVANVARGALAGDEGFVARLDIGLVSAGADRATYLGSAQDDSVTGLAVVGGAVYASGASGGALGGQGAAKTKSGFLARLDSAGAVDWTRSFTTATGALTPAGLAVDAGGASALDALGLPHGALLASDSTALVDRSALRTGDEFKIGADGRILTTITIGKLDTLSSLLARVNRAIGSSGHADLVRENGAERIRIRAVDGSAVRIEAGRAERNALAALGLGEGVISKSSAGRGNLLTFGLGLVNADLKLDSPAAIAKTKAELSAALSIVRRAYEAVVNPNAKEQTEEEKALEARRNASSASAAYYQAQLANYRVALARLGG